MQNSRIAKVFCLFLCVVSILSVGMISVSASEVVTIEQKQGELHGAIIGTTALSGPTIGGTGSAIYPHFSYKSRMAHRENIAKARAMLTENNAEDWVCPFTVEDYDNMIAALYETFDALEAPGVVDWIRYVVDLIKEYFKRMFPFNIM